MSEIESFAKKIVNSKYKKGDMVYFLFSSGIDIHIRLHKIKNIERENAGGLIYSFEHYDGEGHEDYLYTKEEIVEKVKNEIENLDYENFWKQALDEE